VLPDRTEFGSFYFLDCATGDSFDLRATRSIEPIGIEHFYESFGLQLQREKKRDLRRAALSAFRLDVEAIAEDLSVVEEVATVLQPFTCGLRRAARATKKARTEESTTPTRIQDSSSDSSIANGPTSSSDSASSVGASNCDSVLEELEDCYDRLQPLVLSW